MCTNLNTTCANVTEIPLRIILQIIGDTEPESLLASQQVVLVDDSGDGAALADAGAVADQKAAAVVVGQEVGVLLAGVGDRLQLQRGQGPALVHGLGHGEFVPDLGRLHTRQRACFHYWVRMATADLNCKCRETNELLLDTEQ